MGTKERRWIGLNGTRWGNTNAKKGLGIAKDKRKAYTVGLSKKGRVGDKWLPGNGSSRPVQVSLPTDKSIHLGGLL
jgi:hypothetical protein